jgi:hypothetical protein
MIRLADKQIPEQLYDVSRYAVYWCIRFLPSVFVYLLMYLWLVHVSFGSGKVFDAYYWQNDTNSLAGTYNWEHLLLACQSYCMVVFVFLLGVFSMSFVHRHGSIREQSPLDNRVWIVTIIFVLVAQVIFAIITVYSLDGGPPYVSVGTDGLMWYVFIPWPFLVILIDEIVKAHDRSRRDFYHNRARQHFDTVLGMYSPK